MIPENSEAIYLEENSIFYAIVGHPSSTYVHIHLISFSHYWWYAVFMTDQLPSKWLGNSPQIRHMGKIISIYWKSTVGCVANGGRLALYAPLGTLPVFIGQSTITICAITL